MCDWTHLSPSKGRDDASLFLSSFLPLVDFLDDIFFLGYIQLVFKSPVKSSFLTLKWATTDHNLSKLLPILRGLQPNQRGPVLFSLVAPKRPVETGLNCYFHSKDFLFYKLITLQERKNKRKKLPEAQMTMNIVWVLCIHLFDSELGSVVVTGVVAEVWVHRGCGCLEGALYGG